MGSVFADICPIREQVFTLVSCILGLVSWVMSRWRSLYGARLRFHMPMIIVSLHHESLTRTTPCLVSCTYLDTSRISGQSARSLKPTWSNNSNKCHHGYSCIDVKQTRMRYVTLIQGLEKLLSRRVVLRIPLDPGAERSHRPSTCRFRTYSSSADTMKCQSG
jgi:hypothetical protein